MTDQTILGDQENLIRALVVALEQEVGTVQLFETHISWILVTEKYAYKFKKAVHLDFLDFSTLDARHFYCQEELRLNRRLAPDMYLDVVAITGSSTCPAIGGSGIPIEYAVKMMAFSQQALWSVRIGKNRISARKIDKLARKLAQFHQGAAIAPKDSSWSTPDALQKIADENLNLIISLVRNAEEERTLGDLRAWQIEQPQKLRSVFDRRKEQGLIRECHGDLHGGNILTINNQVVVFDCIEFNKNLRWIDVMNDLAFIYMDLQFHGLHPFATRLLNGYLEITGDYEGLAVLRYYQVQRALVRCKVSLLRALQLRGRMRAAASHERLATKYLAFASQQTEPEPSAIIIMHGYSGSGKSIFSGYLAEIIGAVRIRSDVERKRMYGIVASATVAASIGAGLYAEATTQATYDRLRTLALCIAESGMPVVVDATFLKVQQRSLFEKLASGLGVPFFVIQLHASEATLKARVAARTKLGNDPSDAGLEVLAHQLEHHEALSDDETKHTIRIDSDVEVNLDSVRKACVPILDVLKRSVRGYP